MKIFKACCFFYLLGMVCFPAFAAKHGTVKLTETAEVKQDKGMSREETEQKAISNAINKALANEFGKNTRDSKGVTTSGGRQTYYSEYVMVTNGEWVADIDEPIVIPKIIDGEVYYEATVHFLGREIKMAPVLFTAELRRCPDENCRGTQFRHKEKLYLNFTSPAPGYLAVYLEEADTVFCLLPYRNDEDGMFPVTANQSYLLFSRENSDHPQSTMEYMLFASGPLSVMQVHVIYSTQPFYYIGGKDANRTIEGKYKVPRKLSGAQFKEWLGQNRTRDPNMQLKSIPITIEQ